MAALLSEIRAGTDDKWSNEGVQDGILNDVRDQEEQNLDKVGYVDIHSDIPKIPGKVVNFINNMDKLLHVPILIKGKHFTAILDTGSDRSMVSHSIASSLNLNITKDTSTFDVMGQDNLKSVGAVEEMIEVPKLCSNIINLSVFPDKLNPNISILLGTDFMLKNQLEIFVKDRKVVKHSDQGGRVELYLDGSGKPIEYLHCKFPCYAVSSVNISPNNLYKIEVRTNVQAHSNDIFMYEDDDMDTSLSDRVHGLPGVLTPTSKFIYLIGKEKSANIKEGDILGTISSVMTVENEVEDSAVVSDGWEEAIGISHLSTSEQNKLFNVLKGYQETFSSSDQDIGLASVTSHVINLSDDTPIYRRPRRFPQPITDELERQCEELCEADVIEPSISSWSAPIVPVRKKDGTIRMCIDYRELNSVTIPDKFPVPNLLDSIYSLNGNKYFTKLDLVRGYYQVPVDEDSRHYTAFSTQKNHWQFKRLSFGLRNAPAAFQREIQAVLSSFPSNKVIAYLDDILIMGTSFSEHVQLVGKVLQTLKTYGIKIKLSKCEWAKQEVEYLGHLVSETGLKKTPEYVKKVLNYPKPKTSGELREFLGLVNFQRKFVPHCSTIQKPLSSMLCDNKKKVLIWNSESDTAFGTLIENLAHDVELGYPDYSENASKLELWVDASNVGAGAYLAQVQDGAHRIIGFASMSFTRAQNNYDVREKELAALRWGVKTFRPFLLGVEFIIYTDHQPLLYLDSMKLICSRLARTYEELSEYLFEVRYVPGHINTAADALSRLNENMNVPEYVSSGDFLPQGLKIEMLSPGGGDSLFISTE